MSGDRQDEARADMTGETLGPYRLFEPIGEGGMGTVYRAEHVELGRVVAVKVLLPEFAARPESLRRFFNEARTTANLRHPGLLDVMDVGVHKTIYAYIVMEFLRGETLGGRLRRVGRLAPRTALAVAQQIAEAVGVAHGAGIVHRDLTPDNVFMVVGTGGEPERVKVLDFGIAKLGNGAAANFRTRSGMVFGTPLYMAPEQARGAAAVDARADIYSLGCILYAMLCGRPPFVYEGAGELIASHIHEMPASPRVWDPTIPEPVADLVLRLLAKHPVERPPSMAAVWRALAAASRATPTSTTPAPVMAVTPAPLPEALANAPTPPLTNSGPGAVPAVSIRDARTESLPVAGHQPGDPARAEPPRDLSTLSTTATETVAPRERPLRLRVVWAAAVLAGSVAGLSYMELRDREQPGGWAAAGGAVPSLASPAPVDLAVTHHFARPARGVRVELANPPYDLDVTLDGARVALPIVLPADGRDHTLRFSSPSTRPETWVVKADRDRALTLENRPSFALE